jgi:hypothetical protein
VYYAQQELGSCFYCEFGSDSGFGFGFESGSGSGFGLGSDFDFDFGLLIQPQVSVDRRCTRWRHGASLQHEQWLVRCGPPARARAPGSVECAADSDSGCDRDRECR